MMSEKVEL